MYYQIVIEVNSRNGRANNWETLIHSERAVNFLLAEVGGNEKAVISTHRVLNDLAHEVEYHSGLMNAAGKNLEEYLARHGHSSRGFLGISKSLRYFERVLLPGDRISVVGKTLWKSGAQLGFPDKEKMLYIKAIDEKTPLYLSNFSGFIKN